MESFLVFLLFLLHTAPAVPRAPHIAALTNHYIRLVLALWRRGCHPTIIKPVLERVRPEMPVREIKSVESPKSGL
ncbi:MAG: hypothetical protein WDN10_02030 [bacterium]